MNNLTTIAALPSAGGCMSYLPAEILMQDEESGFEGKRYNAWHSSRPDARLNAREAAQAIRKAVVMRSAYFQEQLDLPNPSQLRNLANEQKADQCS